MTALWYCLRGLSAGAGLLLLYAAFFLLISILSFGPPTII